MTLNTNRLHLNQQYSKFIGLYIPRQGIFQFLSSYQENH